MKQYTNSEQTAKLIKLGVEKPKGWNAKNISSRFVMAVDVDADNEFNYSIGELIEMLPQEINNDALPDRFEVYIDHYKKWKVDYSNILGELYSTYRTELIDALYDMCVKLKEDGVI